MVCRLFFWIIGLFSCNETIDPMYIVTVEEKKEYNNKEIELIEGINNYRAMNFMQKCEINDFLSTLAQEHNLYMISQNKVSHDNFDGRVAEIMLKLNVKSIAENISYGYSQVDTIINKWSESEAHRRIIENPNFNTMGLAATLNSKNRLYVTNIFIKR